ncbi:Cys/Met metabolism PLP-dependent enzyme-domain-containing protein [Mycena leptocephala]|nr:Cys/Met metabolism PLP-dependent enzyme-domain-containing protein [Mycena leptocephala]
MASSNPFYREPDFETLQLHAGQVVDPATNARAVPIYQSTSFVLETRAKDLSALGNLYSRVSNPTVDVFEKRMAALEGGMAAVATASGQSATVLAISSLAAVGDNIVSSSKASATIGYVPLLNLISVTFKRYGIDCKFVTGTKPADYAAVIDEKTKAIYVESISNSDTILADIAGLAKVAHDHGIPLVVDNTLGMGGYMIQPIALGADIVVHSATKWISGHGTTLFAMLTGPSAAYGGAKFAEMGSQSALLCRFGSNFPSLTALALYCQGLRDLGPCLSATSAFMTLQGVETLSLRAQRICENALALAKFLEGHPRSSPHPSHQLALKTLRPGSFGGMLTFRVEGGFEKASAIIQNLKLASHLANLGDAKTLVIIPFVTIQSQLSPEERVSSGVYDDMIRYSVGIESVADIIADLEGAMNIAYN